MYNLGMAQDVTDDVYYVSTGGNIPVKWTAPEVHKLISMVAKYLGSYS